MSVMVNEISPAIGVEVIGMSADQLVVPPGTEAEIVLPDGTHIKQPPGTANHECVHPAR